MCGRYSNLTPPEAMRRIFATVGPLPNCPPCYNCAPTQTLPVVRLGPEGRRLELMRWGLIPPWSKGPTQGLTTINARAETIATKPAFRDAFRRRRCLVPADGFYEWRTEGKRKQPFRILLNDGAPFAMAGVWEKWAGPDGQTIHSFAVIVVDANSLVRPIHERMPVILPADAWAAWLAPDCPDPAAFLKPFPAEAMRLYAVSPRVSDPRHDDAECIAPAVELPRLFPLP